MSPRKSSTSSGNRFRRPRYLAVEVTGVPTLSPRDLDRLLRDRLVARGIDPGGVRPIRVEGQRLLVEVPHTSVPDIREAWNGDALLAGGRSVRVATRRSFGTLRKGKEWLRGRPSRPSAAQRPPGV